jgi:hypothetical protein
MKELRAASVYERIAVPVGMMPAAQLQLIGQRDLHGNRQVIGQRIIQHAHILHPQRGRDQDVIDIAYRPPTRKGVQIMGWLTQAGPVNQHSELRTVRTAIEIAHQDHMPVCTGNLADEAKLTHAGALTQRKMH